MVGGLWYFPKKSIKKEYFSPSEETSMCITKGTANFYNLKVDGKSLPDAAWYYPDPKVRSFRHIPTSHSCLLLKIACRKEY